MRITLNGAGGFRTHVQTYFPMNFIGYSYVLYIRLLDKRTKARRLTEDLTRKGQWVFLASVGFLKTLIEFDATQGTSTGVV